MAGPSQEALRTRQTGSARRALQYRGVAAPAAVVALFWDLGPADADLTPYEPLLIRRTLNQGAWTACLWLREVLGDERIEACLRECGGKGFDKKALRLWQILLGLEPAVVDGWLAAPERRIWDGRVSA